MFWQRFCVTVLVGQYQGTCEQVKIYEILRRYAYFIPAFTECLW